MPRPRRLLLVSQPLDAGVPRHVVDLVGGLDESTWRIEVACPRTSLLWARLEGRPHVRLHPLTDRRRPAPGDAASLARLLALVRRVDVVHAHSAKAGFLARLAAALARRRRACVFTPHAWSFWAARGAEARLYERLERLAARWCRTIVVVSDSERIAGLAAGIGTPSQYRVVPNGVDLVRFDADPAPVPGRVLVLGRLARQKRPDVALRAFAAARAAHPEAELQIAADGPDRAATERLARELGLAGSVRFLGPRDDVPALLAQASCLVLASDWEAGPLSVIEAMAAGVPVVATRVGGVPELVADGRTGILVEPGRPAELGAALAGLLSDPERARMLGAAGRAEATRRFSLRRMIDETVAVYDEIP